MEGMVTMREFYKGKRVLVTGNTGFKGSWLTMVLSKWGAELFGYALAPPTKPSMFEMCNLQEKIKWYQADILDFENIKGVIGEIRPDIVFHLAAQPLVGESYDKPIETFSTNVMGTVHLLEAIRSSTSIKAVVNVTTDKCYSNKEGFYGYREDDELGGHDPYSSSKACSELVTTSFRNSFFSEDKIGIATVRAGNVIGGGDFAKDRLIPDCVRSLRLNQGIEIRNPMAVRPWQHVLEPLRGYLALAMHLYQNASQYSGPWNFGPYQENEVTVSEILNLFNTHMKTQLDIICDSEAKYHETNYLKLDSYKANKLLNYVPVLSIDETMRMTVEWYQQYLNRESDIFEFTMNQIESYEKLCFGETK